MDYIPYNQQADPMYYWSQFANNLIGGLMQQQQKKNIGQDVQSILGYNQQMQQQPGPMPTGDIGALGQWATQAKAPQMPQMQSPMGNQMMLQGLMGNLMQSPLEQAQANYYQAGAIEKLQQPQRQGLQSATNLRKEFQASPIYKNFLIVQDSANKMEAAYNESVVKPSTKSRVASDQALAVLFQKMLDPSSVVRESEYARTPEGIGSFNYIKSFIPKLAKGGLQVSDEDRKSLYIMAQKLLDVSKDTMNQHIGNYTNLAQQYGINPSLVFGDIKKFDVGASEDITKMSDEELKRIAGIK